MPIAVAPQKHAPPHAVARTGLPSISTAAARPPRPSRWARLTRRQPGEREIVFFTTRLALLLETGASLNRSLAAIALQMHDPEMVRVVRTLQADVEEGLPLSAALARHPAMFDHVFVGMVRAGESAGILHAMLERQAELLRKQRRFRAALRGSLSYPLFLMALSVVVVLFMLMIIFPRFSTLLDQVRATLPWSTRALMALGLVLRREAAWIGTGTVALILGASWGLGTLRGRAWRERLQLVVPGLGGVLREMYAGRLLLNLGTLLTSRVPLLEAVLITQGLLPRAPYAKFFADLRSSIESGRGLAPAFARSELFPPTVQEMIQTGESGAGLDRIMLRLAEFYEEGIQERIRVFLQILEPILLVLMGAVVAGIALSLILPILRLSGEVH